MSHRTSLEDRLCTYHGWPSGSCQDPRHLAAAGFEYEGTGDRVRCPSCRLRLFDWIHSDPLEQHGKFSEYKCNLYKRIRARLGYNSHQAHSNITSPTGDVLEQDVRSNQYGKQTHAAQTSSQRDRSFVVPETTSGDDEGGLNRCQAASGATASLMRDQVVPTVQYSSECVDAEPPKGTRSCNVLPAELALQPEENQQATRHWHPGQDLAYLDRPELLLLIRHGTDKSTMLKVVRRRLNAGENIIDDTAGLRKEVMELRKS